MKRTDPIAVGDILEDFFAQRRLRGAINEGRAVELWAEVVGSYVAQFTEDVYIRGGVLYVTLSSAAMRSEVHIRRRYYVTLINERMGVRAVRNIMVR